MTSRFLNVEGSPDQPVAPWPYEGLVNVLERGLVSDWRPVFAEIRRQPGAQSPGRSRSASAIAMRLPW